MVIITVMIAGLLTACVFTELCGKWGNSQLWLCSSVWIITHGLENLSCTLYCALQKRFQVGFPPADLSEGLKFDLENILSPLKIQA